MNKETFLDVLKNGLSDFPEGELSDILFYYKDYFDLATDQGKAYDEVLNELGDPYDIVRRYRDNKENINSNQLIVSDSVNNDSNNNSQNNRKFKSNNNYNSNSYNYQKKKFSSSSNFIVTLLIIALSCVLFGPFILGFIGVIGSIFLAVIVSSFSLSIAGVIVLIGKVVTNIGFTVLPSYILDFPNSVLAFSVLGSIFLFIFSVLLLYYFIKLLIHLAKKTINWSSNKIKEEK